MQKLKLKGVAFNCIPDVVGMGGDCSGELFRAAGEFSAAEKNFTTIYITHIAAPLVKRVWKEEVTW
jgi:hypothetical protein